MLQSEINIYLISAFTVAWDVIIQLFSLSEMSAYDETGQAFLWNQHLSIS